MSRDPEDNWATYFHNQWWVIQGSLFLQAMQRAAAGEDPMMLFAEFYANSDTEEDNQ